MSNSTTLIKRIKKLSIAFYIFSIISLFLSLAVSFGDQITQSVEIQFIPSPDNPNQLIAIQELPQWLPQTQITLLIFIVFAFVSYFIWFYNSYQFFLKNNTNTSEQKTFRKTPLGAVVIQLVPILGWVAGQNIIWEISTNNSNKNHSKEAKTNVAVMLYLLSIFGGIAVRFLVKINPTYSVYGDASLWFFYIGSIGMIYIVTKFQTKVFTENNKYLQNDL